jgi:hypothetical protein
LTKQLARAVGAQISKCIDSTDSERSDRMQQFTELGGSAGVEPRPGAIR